MPQPQPINLIFAIERDTKTKVRYQEVKPVGSTKGGKQSSSEMVERSHEAVPKDKAVVDKLYVSKKTLRDLGNPEVLHVTITAP